MIILGGTNLLNKIKGGLIGHAIGDALGGTTEFMSPDEIHRVHGRVTDIIGGGVWDLEPGETTDDTAMTIAVAKGILENSENPIGAIGRNFLHWLNTNPKDVGITIQIALHRYKGDWEEAAKETHFELDQKSAGNGSLMRCLPIALAYTDMKKTEEITYIQSKMTHFDDEAAHACIIYNRMAYRLLQGENLKEVIEQEVRNTLYEKDLYERPDCPADGYVVHTMKWVLYWLLTCETYRDVVVEATNLGGDSDTIAAIAGGLKGIEVGASNLPREYVKKLKQKDELIDLSNMLFATRGYNTASIKEKKDDYISNLERNTKTLSKIIDHQASIVEENELMNQIMKDMYLTKITFNHANPKMIESWLDMEVRYRRLRRLVDLGAPSMIKQHELTWFSTMIHHFDLTLQGIKPRFSKEQLEELEALRQLEESMKD